MIIQCEQCRTKFRLDDSRVKDTGVKVRCAKCKHIFTVRKELPDALPQPDFAALLDQSAGFSEQTPPASPPFAGNVSEESSVTEDSALFELPVEGLPPSATPTADSVFSDGIEWEQALKSDESPFPGIESDFTGFDLGNAPANADKVVEFPFQAQDVPTDQAAQAVDFSEFTVEPAFIDEKTESLKDIKADTFSFDGFDSFPELTTPLPDQPTPTENAVTQEPHVVFRDEQKPEALPETPPPTTVAAAQQELPPLSITSRRKQGPFVKVLLAIVVLVAAVTLYFYYGSTLLQLGTQKTAPEQGNITLRSIAASFVKNATVGEMLVISGEAVNSYTTPRTSIQVKGVVYGDNNQILTSKNAFSGNILSREQLATMPLDKIEAAMANQFGGALDNLEVAPGKAVPFMIIISKLPEGAKNFGALSAGSAAVTKQKP